MARIREDLDGVVTAGSVTLLAGDVIPDGVHVGGHLTDDGLPANAPVAPAQTTPTEVATDVLSEDDRNAAEAIGFPHEGQSPEFVRGALVGHAQGYEDALAQLARVQAEADAADETADDGVIEGQGTLEAFDPADHNAIEVHAYLAEHPDEIPAVLALELAREKPRAGIVDKYPA